MYECVCMFVCVHKVYLNLCRHGRPIDHYQALNHPPPFSTSFIDLQPSPTSKCNIYLIEHYLVKLLIEFHVFPGL